MKKNEFYVIGSDFKPYNILPYLSQEWSSLSPTRQKEALKDLSGWVDRELKHRFWSRCEYELILLNWPSENVKKKIDIYQQALPNLSLIIKLFRENEKIT